MNTGNIDPGILVAIPSEKKTDKEIKDFLKKNKITISKSLKRIKILFLEVPVGLEAVWKEKLMLSGYFDVVDFSYRNVTL